MSKHGIVIRTKVEGISKIGRNTQGVRLMKLDGDDGVAAAAKIVIESEEEVEKAIKKEETGEENGNGEEVKEETQAKEPKVEEKKADDIGFNPKPTPDYVPSISELRKQMLKRR